MNLFKIEKETEDEFYDIAKDLFNQYAIQTKYSLYRLIDIEFYWNSPSHNDKSTYKRTHNIDPLTGEWYFHYSGVDIALKNEKSGGYGGILIRGILDLKTGEIYTGPQVCTMKLFTGINAFTDSFFTRIIKYDLSDKPIQKGNRIGLGKNAIESGYYKSNYRFFINTNDLR